jgi:hypothetical protein
MTIPGFICGLSERGLGATFSANPYAMNYQRSVIEVYKGFYHVLYLQFSTS